MENGYQAEENHSRNGFLRLLDHELSGGVFLIFCTIISLLLANLVIGNSYIEMWSWVIAGEPLTLWINDGLMTLFFLYVGLELKKEIYYGELHNIKKATLPIFAALGGMVVPALIYMSINWGDPETIHGIGIPVATDIAFALAVLTLVGSRVPLALKLFLMALAVIDDLGAIVVIALFYGSDLSLLHLLLALGTLVALFVLNHFKVKWGIVYIIGGILAWYFMHNSGIHATIAGVLLAFVIPTNRDESLSLSHSFEEKIKYPVTFIILPLFALSSTAIIVNLDSISALGEDYGLGIFFGLVVGKPIGITLFSWIACRLGLCALDHTLNWKMVLGAGALGGIGFTMSIFITLLAFDPVTHSDYINNGKLMIIISSTVAAVIGFICLKIVCPKTSLN